MGGDSVIGILGGFAADEALKSGQGGDGELGAGKTDGGKRRLGEVSEGDVIETDERNVARNFEPGVMNGAQGADCGEIV